MFEFLNSVAQAVAGAGPAKLLRFSKSRKDAKQGERKQEDRVCSGERPKRPNVHVYHYMQFPDPDEEAAWKAKKDSTLLPHKLAPGNQRKGSVEWYQPPHVEVSVSPNNSAKTADGDAMTITEPERENTTSPESLLLLKAATTTTSAASLPSLTAVRSNTGDSGYASRRPSPHSSAKSSDSSNTAKQATSADSAEAFGFGRFRYNVNADPKWIKERLMEETRAPGCFNFFGDGGLNLGPHPLEHLYNERRHSDDSNNNSDKSAPLSPLSPTLNITSPSARLAYKNRTESSTTISADGCIIQRGFDLSASRRSSNAVSTSTRSSSTSSSNLPLDQQRLTRPIIQRRITFDDKVLSRIEDDDLEETVCKYSNAATQPPAFFDTAPQLRGRQDQPRAQRVGEAKRNRSEQPIRTRKVSVHKPKHTVPQKQRPNIKIVPPDEAENAIESDDDALMTVIEKSPTRPKDPWAAVAQPRKSILKKPAERLGSNEGEVQGVAVAAEGTKATFVRAESSSTDGSSSTAEVRQKKHVQTAVKKGKGKKNSNVNDLRIIPSVASNLKAF